jgi:hypothetical protein
MNNALQAIGNKHKARIVTDPAFFSARESMEENFKAVLVLKPHASLFQWTSVSNIPAGLLDDAIKNMSKNAQQLQHPPSSDDISTLTKGCSCLAYFVIMHLLLRGYALCCVRAFSTC